MWRPNRKHVLIGLLVLVVAALILTPILIRRPKAITNWYVRSGGGTRAQCDGKTDVDLAGSTGGHCAFGDFRSLYSDHAGGALSWIIAGGDVVTVHGGPYRIGSDTDGTVNSPWCNGSNQTCYIPSPPPGTASNLTVIQGENCINGCPDTSNGNIGPDTTKLTELYGGYGLYKVIQLSTSFVTFKGFSLTRHSDCIQHGYPALPSTCNNSPPFSDFAIGGINTDQTTHDIDLQDVWVHGFPDRGVLGAIGGLVTCQRCRISYNGMAGWDFDDGGNHLPSVNNPTLKFLYSILEFSGCNQEYPYTHPFPVTSCYGQSTSGYGDGLATVPGSPESGVVDHSIMRYNTQDGMDWGHVDTGTSTLTLTNSVLYGNNGGQFKWGYNFSNVTLTNNLIVGNCERMSVPLAGAPSTYNANLQDFCRAGSTLSSNFRTGQTSTFAHNTVIGYGPGLWTLGCSNAPANGACHTDTFTMYNNILLGYENPVFGDPGNVPSGFYCQDNTSLPNPNQIDCPSTFTWARSNNLFYQFKPLCPTGWANETCNTSPLLVNQPTGNGSAFVETELDLPSATYPGGSLSFNLTSASPAIHAGIDYSGQPTSDFAGNPQTSPLTLGALVYQTSTPTVTTPTATPAPGIFTTATNVSLFATPNTAKICYTTNGTIPTTAANNCGAGSTTYTGPFTVSATSTVKAIATLAGYTDSGIFSGTYTIQTAVPVAATPTATPGPGSFASATNVALYSATNGAKICFTTNSNPPTTSGNNCGAGSTTYTGQITVSTTTTIQAVATLAGYTDSGMFSGTYTILQPPVATPTASPAPGTFASTVNVSLFSPTNGATICYTTDGTLPCGPSGTTYTGPIVVPSTTTIRAIASLAGRPDSGIFSGLYSITAPPVVIVVGGVEIRPAPGVLITNPRVINGHVSFTAATSGPTNAIASVYYRSGNLKYLSCAVVGNGELNAHGLSWSSTANNLLVIATQTLLQPGQLLNIHVDCWTA